MVNDGSTPPPPGPIPPGPYGGPRTGFSGRGTRFFDWMRSLGVVRTDGWIGGVFAGLAYRIGIDPLIVRGIVVVAALLGAPVLLLYALAWALLPDRDGRIHLQRLFEGEFEPPIVAIGVLVILSLLPWSSGIWWFGGPFGHDPGWWDVFGHVFWTLVVLGAAAALIAVAVRNADKAAPGSYGAATATAARSADPYAGGASADTSAQTADPTGASLTGQTAGLGAQTADLTAPAAASPDVVPALAIGVEPSAPPTPGAGASNEEVADWRTRQAQWKAEHDRWKQRLAEDMRVVKAQRTAELRAQAAAAHADAEARRAAYRAANPRVGAAIGWLSVGLALVAGALTGAFWGTVTGLPGSALTASLAAATLVFGATILIAGIARRRSGFLIFLGLLFAVLTLAAALLPAPGAHLWLD